MNSKPLRAGPNALLTSPPGEGMSEPFPSADLKSLVNY
jgi:hypothetical protein